MPDICVVVPTVREASILAFLEAWSAELSSATLIVVEDNPERSFPLARANLFHYAWSDIERDLADRAWIIPRRSDCIRSYGYYKAHQMGARVVVTLDDDCLPSAAGFLAAHVARLDAPAAAERWVTTGRGLKPRGVPYHTTRDSRSCVLSHGLWTGVPDLDAVTQLVGERLDAGFEPVDQVIPPGSYFPMCGMNLAFRRELVPAMYFLLMGGDHAFDRFGDIWCGVLVKKLCDHLNLAVVSGPPLVEHRRASNVWDNLRKELPGYPENERFWRAVDAVTLTSATVREAYVELAAKLALEGSYWDRTRAAMHVWASLFA